MPMISSRPKVNGKSFPFFDKIFAWSFLPRKDEAGPPRKGVAEEILESLYFFKKGN